MIRLIVNAECIRSSRHEGWRRDRYEIVVREINWFMRQQLKPSKITRLASTGKQIFVLDFRRFLILFE